MSRAELVTIWTVTVAGIAIAAAAIKSHPVVALAGLAAITPFVLRSAVLRSVFAPVTLLVLALMSQSSGHPGWATVCALAAVFYGVIAAAWVQGRQVEARALEQWNGATRDHVAELEQQIAAGAPFVLYLRGFASESPQPEMDWTDFGVFVVGHKYDRDPQKVIGGALPDRLPIFAVANQRSLDPSPVFPEVIVPDDDSWGDVVRAYAVSAAIVVVWYEHASDGLEAECDLLAADAALGAKTWLTFNSHVRERGAAFERLRTTARWVSGWTRGQIDPRPQFTASGEVPIDAA